MISELVEKCNSPVNYLISILILVSSIAEGTKLRLTLLTLLLVLLWRLSSKDYSFYLRLAFLTFMASYVATIVFIDINSSSISPFANRLAETSILLVVIGLLRRFSTVLKSLVNIK